MFQPTILGKQNFITISLMTMGWSSLPSHAGACAWRQTITRIMHAQPSRVTGAAPATAC